MKEAREAVAEEPVEVVRNGEDGTKRAWDAREGWTPPADVALREETPRKAPASENARADVTRRTLNGRQSAREDHPAGARKRARRGEEDREDGSATIDAMAGSRNPMPSVLLRRQDFEAQPTR